MPHALGVRAWDLPYSRMTWAVFFAAFSYSSLASLAASSERYEPNRTR